MWKMPPRLTGKIFGTSHRTLGLLATILNTRLRQIWGQIVGETVGSEAGNETVAANRCQLQLKNRTERGPVDMGLGHGEDDEEQEQV